MAQDKTEFLKFSAYSIKDAIIRKLTQDSKFTDQVYEGSNLMVLIDIVSYIYQCLTYQLNNAASESMFSDTMLYDNMVRLVKFLGYQPKGCTPASLAAYVVTEDQRGRLIPPYSRVDTGLTDSSGRKIYYSLPCGDMTTGSFAGEETNSNSRRPITLQNGEWKLYNVVFTASGVENETFVLDNIRSDSASGQYVAHDFIDVYVAHQVYDAKTSKDDWEYQQWHLDKNNIFTGYSSAQSNNSRLFNNETPFMSLYPGTYKVYTAYLNEDKEYEIKFGNGIVGAKLSRGDKVYVFYLDTNGPDGTIDVSDIGDQSKLFFEHSPEQFGITRELYNKIFQIQPRDEERYLTADQNTKYNIQFRDPTSTTAVAEETVDEIRTNAPLWFSTGNRLITKFDYEYYLKNVRNSAALIGCDIIDVKCMNNYEYCSKFYEWLYEMGANGKLVGRLDDSRADGGNPDFYLNKSRFTRYNYFFSDPSDACNLYLWLKSSNDSFDVASVTSNLNQALNPIKLMTAELLACKAINVNFDICAAPEDCILDNVFAQGETNVGAGSFIEITLDDNALYVASSLQKQVYDIIISGFSVNKCQLGQLVNYDDILNEIYSINGVQKVRTVFKSPDLSVKSRSFDGLSFASWSQAGEFILQGDDLDISNTVRQMRDFQFPVFSGRDTLLERILVIKKSLSTVNTIKF